MTDHDSDRFVVLSMEEKLTRKSRYEVAVNDWTVGEQSVRRKTDLDNVRQLSFGKGDITRLGQSRDVQ